MTQQTLTPRTPNLVWGIIDISDMPKRFRLDVEQLFVEYLPSPAPSEDTRDYAAIDALSAEWFTQWRRSRSNPGTVSCRQTLSAHPAGRIGACAGQVRLRARLHRDSTPFLKRVSRGVS